MEECGFSEIEKGILKEVAGLYAIPEGAYNFRVNGKSVSRKSSANIDIDIVDGGLEIRVKPGTKNESVFILETALMYVLLLVVAYTTVVHLILYIMEYILYMLAKMQG